MTTHCRHCPYHVLVGQEQQRNPLLSIEVVHMCQKAKLIHKGSATCHYDPEILAKENLVVGAEKGNCDATNRW